MTLAAVTRRSQLAGTQITQIMVWGLSWSTGVCPWPLRNIAGPGDQTFITASLKSSSVGDWSEITVIIVAMKCGFSRYIRRMMSRSELRPHLNSGYCFCRRAFSVRACHKLNSIAALSSFWNRVFGQLSSESPYKYSNPNDHSAILLLLAFVAGAHN